MEFSSDMFLTAMHYIMSMLLLAASILFTVKVACYIKIKDNEGAHIGGVVISVLWTMTALSWHLL